MPKSRRHYRVTLIDVLDAHNTALKLGGLDGVRDIGLVESAVARPYAGIADRPLYRTISEKAAALVHSLVQNHGFVDGNKRTAVLCMGTLLERTEYTLNATNRDVEAMVEAVATSDMSFDDLVTWFKQRVR